MKFYKSNSGKYYASDRLIDALERAKIDTPNMFICVIPVRQAEIPRGTEIVVCQP